jgi:hypothetical protein
MLASAVIAAVSSSTRQISARRWLIGDLLAVAAQIADAEGSVWQL